MPWSCLFSFLPFRSLSFFLLSFSFSFFSFPSFLFDAFLFLLVFNIELRRPCPGTGVGGMAGQRTDNLNLSRLGSGIQYTVETLPGVAE